MILFGPASTVTGASATSFPPRRQWVPGCVKTPSFNLRVGHLSRFRRYGKSIALATSVHRRKWENNSLHPLLAHVFTQPGSQAERLMVSTSRPLRPKSRHRAVYEYHALATDTLANARNKRHKTTGSQLKPSPPLGYTKVTSRFLRFPVFWEWAFFVGLVLSLHEDDRSVSRSSIFQAHL
jgi:hypothetical protein